MTAKTEDRSERREFHGTGMYWSLLLGVILAIAILIGIVQNAQSVQLKYLVWDLSTPLIVVLLVTIVASVLLTALVGVVWRHRRRRQLTDREELRGLRESSPDPASAKSETPTLERDPASP
ncbi:MAG: LapA family protein [Candidatus Dormibacteria bacterium]